MKETYEKIYTIRGTRYAIKLSKTVKGMPGFAPEYTEREVCDVVFRFPHGDGGLCTPMTTIEEIIQFVSNKFGILDAETDHDLEELRAKLTTLVAEQRAEAYADGMDAGSHTVGGSGRTMYEKGKVDGAREALAMVAEEIDALDGEADAYTYGKHNLDQDEVRTIITNALSRVEGEK